MNVKKTTLLVFIGLITVGGAGAYAFNDEMFDEYLDDLQDKEDVVDVIEEPESILKDLVAKITVNTQVGTNYYSMEEVDDGDNNEVQNIEWDNYTFQFDAYASAGEIEKYLWNFGDNNELEGIEGEHSYSKPGKYIVTLKITSIDGISMTNQTMITVDFEGLVISDNMECTCAPTAKETTIDLKIENGATSIVGETTVTHDGSSEDCTQRNLLQQCHLRVILKSYNGGSLISEEVLFDDTFSTNSKTVNFTRSLSEDENEHTFELVLETDQLRDWHKPETEWIVNYTK
jgi:PKD repeat protein|tara:strand:- start:395 stop:1258 length:864 start_codon:yes stop_codon:yes gene_type:complete